VRRLYSTFAGGWPGAGLLLLRLVGGSVVLVRAAANLLGDAPLNARLTSASLAGSGVLLITGFWTPLAGAAVAAIEMSRALSIGQEALVSILAGTVGGALAMLGPGRWSVDAHLYGWKRIEAPSRGRRSSSS
jgi:uncharacterized membrane protein YphA (DoxX/SURF4 family)